MLLTPLLRRAPPPESGTLQIMVNQEASRYQSRDYFHSRGIVPGQVNVEVNVEVRQKLIEWMVHVHDYAKYTVDTLEIAISILDRYLLTAVGADALKDRDEYQLAAVVAFYCPSKSHEKIPFSAISLAEISAGFCTVDDIERMERKMLPAIQWSVNPPTSFSFITEIVDLLPSHVFGKLLKREIKEIASLQALDVLGAYNYLAVKKSLVAVGAVMNTLHALSIKFDLPSFLLSSGNVTAASSRSWEELLPLIQDDLLKTSTIACTWQRRTETFGMAYPFRPVSPRSTMEDVYA